MSCGECAEYGFAWNGAACVPGGGDACCGTGYVSNGAGGCISCTENITQMPENQCTACSHVWSTACSPKCNLACAFGISSGCVSCDAVVDGLSHIISIAFAQSSELNPLDELPTPCFACGGVLDANLDCILPEACVCTDGYYSLDTSECEACGNGLTTLTNVTDADQCVACAVPPTLNCTLCPEGQVVTPVPGEGVVGQASCVDCCEATSIECLVCNGFTPHPGTDGCFKAAPPCCNGTLEASGVCRSACDADAITEADCLQLDPAQWSASEGCLVACCLLGQIQRVVDGGAATTFPDGPAPVHECQPCCAVVALDPTALTSLECTGCGGTFTEMTGVCDIAACAGCCQPPDLTTCEVPCGGVWDQGFDECYFIDPSLDYCGCGPGERYNGAVCVNGCTDPPGAITRATCTEIGPPTFVWVEEEDVCVVACDPGRVPYMVQEGDPVPPGPAGLCCLLPGGAPAPGTEGSYEATCTGCNGTIAANECVPPQCTPPAECASPIVNNMITTLDCDVSDQKVTGNVAACVLAVNETTGIGCCYEGDLPRIPPLVIGETLDLTATCVECCENAPVLDPNYKGPDKNWCEEYCDGTMLLIEGAVDACYVPGCCPEGEFAPVTTNATLLPASGGTVNLTATCQNKCSDAWWWNLTNPFNVTFGDMCSAVHGGVPITINDTWVYCSHECCGDLGYLVPLNDTVPEPGPGQSLDLTPGCQDCCTATPGSDGNGPVPNATDAACTSCGGTLTYYPPTVAPELAEYSYCEVTACCGGSPYNTTNTSLVGGRINTTSLCPLTEAPTLAPTSPPTTGSRSAGYAATSAPVTSSPATSSPATSSPTTAPMQGTACESGEYEETLGGCRGECLPCASVIEGVTGPGAWPPPNTRAECGQCGGLDTCPAKADTCGKGRFAEVGPCDFYEAPVNGRVYGVCRQVPDQDRGLRVGQCFACDNLLNPPDAPAERIQCFPDECPGPLSVQKEGRILPHIASVITTPAGISWAGLQFMGVVLAIASVVFRETAE